jgi:hypothetical protein
MSLSKSKCWYSSNCLQFLRHAVPFTQAPRHLFHNKIRRITYTPRVISCTPICMPPLRAACKVFLSGMQTLENYASHHCCLLHGTNVPCCMLHAVPQVHFYETVKIATSVVCLGSLWCMLGS